MTDNPYSQPSAAVQAEHDLLPFKPVAVSMYRFFAWIAVLVALLGFFQLFDPVRLESGKSIAEGIAPRVVLLLAMGVVVVCGYRRNRLCEFVAVILIAALGVSSSLLCIAFSVAGSGDGAPLWISLAVVVFLVFIYWIYAFGFSVKARRYFST
ncbi:hypothetical protein ACN9MY_23035 [Pseudoduganella sp. R-31]|uniref:hypothetical protein n=1 Tax=Pseudoduganella sp. R-31 TaxID=3404060 RepID=UPI003CF62F96